MSLTLGVVMDPIGDINFKKDTTLAMLLAAQRRGWSLRYMEQRDLFLDDGVCHVRSRSVEVRADPESWFTLGDERIHRAGEMDVVLMRKDPPFDMEFVHTTYMLDRMQADGVTVVNRPQSLRDANEKMFTAWFPQCCPPTVVARDRARLYEFLDQQGDIIVKPLDGMGGASIFRVRSGDPNTNVVFETMTEHETRFCMAQRYLPEIVDGDKRVLMIEGEPASPYALARIPAEGDARGNLAAGAEGVGIELTDRHHWLCEQIGPTLREKGLVFVGLDVIGDYVTEINVTSPTCVRELEDQFGVDIAGRFMDAVEARTRSNR